MYQSYSPYYEYNENSRTEYYHPMLYPMADYFPAAYDERQFNLPPFSREEFWDHSRVHQAFRLQSGNLAEENREAPQLVHLHLLSRHNKREYLR